MLERERSLTLDLGLAIGVAMIIAAYSEGLPWLTRLWLSVGVGAAFAFAARAGLDLLNQAPAASPAQLQEAFEAHEARLRTEEELDLDERIELTDSAGSMAMMLHNWPRAIHHYKMLDRLLREYMSEAFESLEVLQHQRLQTQLALAYAYLQDGQVNPCLVQLESLQSDPIAQQEPLFMLLVELCDARARAEEAPALGQQLIHEALERARGGEFEEDALHLVAVEWLELGYPAEAIALLEQAHQMATTRSDRWAQAESLYRLTLAHCQAGHLEQAASLFTRLKWSYVATSLPTTTQLDELHQTLSETFGLRTLQDALSQAEQRQGSTRSWPN